MHKIDVNLLLKHYIYKYGTLDVKVKDLLCTNCKIFKRKLWYEK